MKKDFIAIADYSSDELMKILQLASELKNQYFSGGNPPFLKGKVMGMIFQKPSLRTRVSFDMAMRHLGGDALYLSPNEIGLGQRESIADVARVLSGYVQIIMARVFSHDHILELARWSSIPVINGLSDYNHPCQAMADALTIIERLGNIKDRKVVFVGDGNNVAVSMMHVCSKLGAHFTHSGPEGYQLASEPLQLAHEIAKSSGSNIEVEPNPQKAVTDADVIYTDTWTSMGQEAESEKRARVFPPYQVNSKLLKYAKPTAIVLHCLPAHRGQEITDEVADGSQSALFQQAHNRLHAQKAILVHIMREMP